MRDPILAADVTLDGFVARPANDLDFVVPDDERDQTMMTELPSARSFPPGTVALVYRTRTF
jgi:hypothetical protein